jgi:hypothetical protein
MGPLTLILAVLSTALGGGTYEGGVDTPCDSSCVVLLVTADDGRSLTTRSIVAPPCDLAETAGAFPESAPRGTPVRRDGFFRWRSRYQVVEGRFSADGRTASGTARFLGLARSDCSSATATFSARLARRAKPNGTCEKLTKGRLDVEVFVRRTGCTKATRVVDAWRLDRDCVTTALTLRPCRTAGRRCTPVDGGRLRNLAGVACRAGRSEIELVIRKGCAGQGPSRIVVKAINVDCATARVVANTWQRRASCPSRPCTVAGWTCAVRRHIRCRRGHSAVEISETFVIPD